MSYQKNIKILNFKSSFQKLTFDVICSTCFGVQTDSIKNPNDPFTKAIKDSVCFELTFGLVFAGLNIYLPNYKNNTVSLFTAIFPKLAKKLSDWNICEFVVSKKSIDFIQQFVEILINSRRNKEKVLI